MERIAEAVERARESWPRAHRHGQTDVELRTVSSARSSPPGPREKQPASIANIVASVALDRSYLEERRIVAFDSADVRSRPFDWLRTQVLREMDERGWQSLAITSPTSACGRTFTALNLTLSVARQPERSVLLIDMDMRKPEVAERLGLRRPLGISDYLAGRASLQDVIVRTEIGGHHALVLPRLAPIPAHSSAMSPDQMMGLVQRLKMEFKSSVLIFDMPPMLISDDAMSLLPEIDCTLLVLAAGRSTTSELKACQQHLQAANLTRVVLNKACEVTRA